MLDIQTGQRPMFRHRWTRQKGCVGWLRKTSWNIYRIRLVRRSFDVLALFSVARLILVRTGTAPAYSRCVEHYSAGCGFDLIGYFIMGLFCYEQVMKILALGKEILFF